MPAQEPEGARFHARSQRRWAFVNRGLWVALAAFLLFIFFTSLPRVIAQMRTPCQPGACPWLAYTAPQIEAFNATMFPYNTFVMINVGLGVVSMVVPWLMSLLIIWRRANDWMAALVAFMLLVSGSTFTSSSLPTGAQPWLNPNAYALELITIVPPVVFSLFPSGRFAPGWTRWLLALVLIVQAPLEFLSGAMSVVSTPLGPIGWVIEAGILIALAGAQIYRYRAVSTPIERQQTKWALVGFAAPVAMVAILFILTLLAAAFRAPSIAISFLYPDIGFILPIAMAIGFGFAMLRSRLWEIDALINRAMVYGALTLILAVSYAGLVIGLQTALRGVTGQNNSAIIVVSTLVIAALFQPARQRLQSFIDRRFYRHKYDAATTLQAFSASLRHEVRDEALRQRLLAVVSETMRPAHVSLWLRPTTQDASDTPSRPS